MRKKLHPIQQDRPTSPESFDSHTVTPEERLPLEILSSGTDWNLWKKDIEKHARCKGVWEYCNPDLPKQSYPELEEPEGPNALEMYPGADAIDDLGEEHFTKLAADMDRYQKEYRSWARIERGARQISNLIKTHVDSSYLKRIEGTKSPRDELEILAAEYRFTRLAVLELKWENILSMAGDADIYEFFEMWKTSSTNVMSTDMMTLRR